MYIAAFNFEPGEYDARFHELNALIDAAARATPGFLGAESWRSPDGRRANATYYWTTLEALREFSNHPKHVEAKREYRKWYRGYQIVISQVVRSYGDGAYPHFTPDERAGSRDSAPVIDPQGEQSR
jgi:heme-degrading monooxygenase HmoA